MAVFSQEFKVQSVEKALSRNPNQSLKQIAMNLGVGYSTLQKWIRLAKHNQLEKPESNMSKEKSPHDWNKAERFEAIAHCHHLTDDQVSGYCREKGIYPHHIKAWKAEFLLDSQSADPLSKQTKKAQKRDQAIATRAEP